MRRLAHWLIAIGALMIFLISVAMFMVYRVSEGIKASVEYKSAKITSATILSVAEVVPSKLSKIDDNDKLFKICFTMDNFSQIETEMRQGYQTAESKRIVRDGPRCKVTAKATIARNLSKGDKLSVVYLLENEYQIDVVAVAAYGEKL